MRNGVTLQLYGGGHITIDPKSVTAVADVVLFGHGTNPPSSNVYHSRGALTNVVGTRKEVMEALMGKEDR